MAEISAGLITNKEMATIRKSLPRPNNPSKNKQREGWKEPKNKEEEADLNRPGGTRTQGKNPRTREQKRGTGRRERVVNEGRKSYPHPTGLLATFAINEGMIDPSIPVPANAPPAAAPTSETVGHLWPNDWGTRARHAEEPSLGGHGGAASAAREHEGRKGTRACAATYPDVEALLPVVG